MSRKALPDSQIKRRGSERRFNFTALPRVLPGNIATSFWSAEETGRNAWHSEPSQIYSIIHKSFHVLHSPALIYGVRHGPLLHRALIQNPYESRPKDKIEDILLPRTEFQDFLTGMLDHV